MKALTGLGVSQQDKEGQSFLKKNAVFCDGACCVECVCQHFKSTSESKHILGDLCGDFLHCCSIIKELAVAQSALFHI